MLVVISGNLHVQFEGSDMSYTYLTVLCPTHISQCYVIWFIAVFYLPSSKKGLSTTVSRSSFNCIENFMTSINLIQGYCSFWTILISQHPQAIYNDSQSTFIWVLLIIWVIYVTVHSWVWYWLIPYQDHMDWLRVFSWTPCLIKAIIWELNLYCICSFCIIPTP